ncbi:MAG: ABC transporter ATP-binding protein [Deltaproteobacteria bacterium RIFOXYD12_FULL_50_9]|nr:MAG: ABC transporter ATP-binding protein [Deltaproteobacteria bacterium RIFOXYD12_FULL_50_9]
MTPLVVLDRVSKHFGGLKAVERISFTINQGLITGLIGPNGAGKTTLFNCITGMYQPTSGSITWCGAEKSCLLNRLKPHQVTRLGLARTFQNIRLFANMTALENVMVGRHIQSRAGILGAIFKPARVRSEEQEIISQARRILGLVGLADRAGGLAKNLAYGEQRRLEIARALATEPQLLLLDEPAAGLNPSETEDLDALIKKLQQELRLTILLIEHDMKLVMNISDEIVVLDHGELIAQGPPAVVARDRHVIAAYLGEEFC